MSLAPQSQFPQAREPGGLFVQRFGEVTMGPPSPKALIRFVGSKRLCSDVGGWGRCLLKEKVEVRKKRRFYETSGPRVLHSRVYFHVTLQCNFHGIHHEGGVVHAWLRGFKNTTLSLETSLSSTSTSTSIFTKPSSSTVPSAWPHARTTSTYHFQRLC